MAPVPTRASSPGRRTHATAAPTIVVKFGGTALGNSSRIRLAAKRIGELRSNGLQPVVVVSATGKTTDRLLRELRSVSRARATPASTRETDRALATGEALSAALLAAALSAIGIPAASVSASEAVLVAVGPYGAARLSELRPGRIAELAATGIVPVVAGFQGVRDDGELVTLGRGSSDVTAVFLATALGADECHIVTDVNGIHEEDPRVAPASPRYPLLSFDGLVDLTGRGAQVVHPLAAASARAGAILLHVYHYRASLTQPAGTMVWGDSI